MPDSQLSAIYNNCWRNHHNDIEPDKNKLLLDSIKLVCGIKAIEISGHGGNYEFKQLSR